MTRRILFSVVVTNLALMAWAAGWSALASFETYVLIQGTTLVAGGAIAAWMLYIQHQYEEIYYETAAEWSFEAAAVKGSSYLELRGRSCGPSGTPTTTTCTTSARGSRTTTFAPRTRNRRCSRR